jgi:hypothetical protein
MFSFGIDAPEPVAGAARDGQQGASFILSGQDLSDTPGGKEFQAVIDGVVEFYHANKFKDASLQSFFTYSTTSPDSTVSAFLQYTNMFSGMPASAGVPDGPLLWVSHSSANISAEAISKTDDEAAQAASTVDESLARAGMTYDAYKEYLGPLAIAKTDAADPSVLDVTLDAPGLSADQEEGLKDMRDFYAIRRSNLKVYQKMASQVGPVLEHLGL